MLASLTTNVPSCTVDLAMMDLEYWDLRAEWEALGKEVALDERWARANAKDPEAEERQGASERYTRFIELGQRLDRYAR